jgi:D-inositol-3-phosphate glycosyltransferase
MKRTCLVIDACQFSANYNYCLLDALAKKGERIVYATTEFAHGHIPDPPGVKVFRYFFFLARVASRITSSGSVRRFLRAIEYPLNLCILLTYALVRRVKVVVFIWIVSPWLDYWVIRLLKLMGRRVVYTAHNPFPHEERPGDIQRYCRIYKSVEHIIALTYYTRNEIVRRCRISADKISVIPHGDYDALFSQYGFNDALAQKVLQKVGGRKIIGFLGGIRPYKGLEFFIEALTLIKQRMPESFFLVAGSLLIGNKEELEEKLARSCRPEDLWADIRFLPVEDLKAYLSVTNVLVQPYTSASQSGNTAMAYAAGIPVISTNVGGLGEMTEDGTTGYVIGPCDPEAIANAVAKCFERDNCSKMADNARRAVKEQYGWEKIAERTADVYHHIRNDPKKDYV